MHALITVPVLFHTGLFTHFQGIKPIGIAKAATVEEGDAFLALNIIAPGRPTIWTGSLFNWHSACQWKG